MIPVKNDGITVNLSSEADSDSVLNNITLLKDDNNVAVTVNINGGQINIVPAEGFEYGPVTQEYFGCSQKNVEKKIECYYDKAYAPTQCYYDGELCGYYCDYNGTNCGAVFLPQCALEGHCPQT